MWMQLLVSFAMMVVSSMLSSAAASKVEQKDPEAGKLDIPTAEEGRPVSVVFGTCLVKSANVNWYGDPNTTAIKSSSGGKK
jgi:hypothetical protein